jgi:hypothetical protein
MITFTVHVFFWQFKELTVKLIDMWTYHKTPAEKVLPFPEVFVLFDAVDAEAIIQHKVLSSTTKRKVCLFHVLYMQKFCYKYMDV